ncbi:hypothetical protein ACHAWF_013217, partial [Thalassiosira exigua]
ELVFRLSYAVSPAKVVFTCFLSVAAAGRRPAANDAAQSAMPQPTRTMVASDRGASAGDQWRRRAWDDASDPAPGASVDEVEVDRVPTANGNGGAADDFGDDDATDASLRSGPVPRHVSLAGVGTDGSSLGGSIRMEGWLSHTTSSHRDSGGGGGGGGGQAGPGGQPGGGTAATIDGQSVAAPPAPSGPPSSSSASILSKTVSKKKRQATRKPPRYFVLRGGTLSYYARRHDVKAKGTFVLTRGCAVGPVTYGSLEVPPSARVPATGEREVDDGGVVPPSPSPRDVGAMSVSASTVTEPAHNKSKKKKRRLYYIQVTWPTNDIPSKDEQFMAQAKAQVAAESENESLSQRRLEMESSLSDATGGGNNTGSPVQPGSRVHRRGRSEPSQRAIEGQVHTDLYAPDLMDDNDNGNDKEQRRLLPSQRAAPPSARKHAASATLNTPAQTLSGMNAFGGEKIHMSNQESKGHETGLHKHYTQQVQKEARDRQKSEKELQKVEHLIRRKVSRQETKKKVIHGTKVAAMGTAAITAGVLTAGIGLAAGLVFVGIAGAAGGSGMVGGKVLGKARGKYHQHKGRKCFHLILGAETFKEAMRWKAALEGVIQELARETEEDEEELEWSLGQTHVGSGELDGSGGDTMMVKTSRAATAAPLTPKRTPANGNVAATPTSNGVGGCRVNSYCDLASRWVPIQGGGAALWGILGALGGGGNLRIYREERSPLIHPSPWLFDEKPKAPAFPSIPRFRTDVGLAGQPFPPFKASVVLKANSLDAFMCLMCSGRILDDEGSWVQGRGRTGPHRVPVPNSGQIASFRIIETMDDHMDVVHLVFRPLYLFPSWTAPRDFVLYRFWKHDDDGSYQVCFDSGLHRDCPPAPGYVRGEMHGVYTIAPLKRKRGRGTRNVPTTSIAPPSTAGAGRSNKALTNEECLLSHVVQIDPRGWVPTTSMLPFLRSQGYGDAFAIMALHQMLDVKEALDSTRFVTVPIDGTQPGIGADFGQNRGLRRMGAKPEGRIMAAPSRGLSSDASIGSARSVVDSRSNQLYVANLNRSMSEDASMDEEPDGAHYDFKYSETELFPVDGYHHSPPSIADGHYSSRLDRQGNMDSNQRGAVGSLISTVPPPMVNEWWAEPDANSFRVRGKFYKSDNKKVNAGSSLFRLIAAEIVETDIPIMSGMCTHPKERVQLAMQRDREAKAQGIESCEMVRASSRCRCIIDFVVSLIASLFDLPSQPPYVFVVNIALPGPPHYHMVYYYAVDDLSMIDGSDGTPSSRLCNEFFFTKDDAFRDNTFKLIPQIIEGNFMVRKAVGSTPAIMGTKIKQTYIQGERFFELMIDTGSSAVAAGVIRICNGYSKMIAVDLAFLFEGHSEQTLPERVLGCVRLKNAEFGKRLRFVESVDE